MPAVAIRAQPEKNNHRRAVDADLTKRRGPKEVSRKPLLVHAVGIDHALAEPLKQAPRQEEQQGSKNLGQIEAAQDLAEMSQPGLPSRGLFGIVDLGSSFLQRPVEFVVREMRQAQQAKRGAE